MAVFHSADLTTMNGAALATLLPGIFILPFFLFSATAGQIADKFEKSKLIRFVKIFEVVLMLFAALGFVLHVFWLLVSALFMMGMHSTLFGPVKYAYLPQHLAESELVGGNGMVEMGTFVAILLGQMIGAGLGMHQGGELVTGFSILGLALLGYLASNHIPNSPAAEPGLKINWNPITATGRNIAFVWKSQAIWLAIIGISWFWFYGATLLAQFPVFAKEVLHGDESVFILLLAVFSVGVGLGSLLCEKLSKGIVEIGLVPIGAMGMMAFGVDLYTASASGIADWRLLGDIALIGLFGGVYIVPLYALIQSRAPNTHQSRVMAANSILNAFFMVISAMFAMFIFNLGLNIPELFLITALTNALVIIYLCLRQPEYFSRMKSWRL
jgi:MFS family permease